MTVGEDAAAGGPTPAQHCGLILALPMTSQAVQLAFDGGPYADYVKRAGSRGASALWERGFRMVAAAACGLAKNAATLGVLVAKDATLDDVTRIFSARAVVTLVAHWRGPQVSGNDILIDPDVIAQRLAGEQSDFAILFREGGGAQCLDAVASGNDRIRRSRLAETIDRRLSRYPALVPAPAGVEWSMDHATLRHMNRVALDAWWPQAFRPGNRLELSDGLHGMEAVAAAVPSGWAGISDLSNCQSAQFVQSIKKNRPDRVVIANERDTNPLRRLALLSAIYGLVSGGGVNYAEARSAMAMRMMRNGRGKKL